MKQFTFMGKRRGLYQFRVDAEEGRYIRMPKYSHRPAFNNLAIGDVMNGTSINNLSPSTERASNAEIDRWERAEAQYA